MTTNRPSSVKDFMARLPVISSYIILISTWLAFLLFISIYEILLKRGDVYRFLEQIIIYHTLLALTLIAHITTYTRSPGRPNTHLTRSLSIAQETSSFYGQKGDAAIQDNDGSDDDVPLRHLRNTQWVNSRIHKDRPSPLPLPVTLRTGSTRVGVAAPTSKTKSESSDSDSDSNEDDDSYALPAISPFPFGGSPFVPKSSKQAGEDKDDRQEVKSIEEVVEGIKSARGPGHYLDQRQPEDDSESNINSSDTQAFLPQPEYAQPRRHRSQHDYDGPQARPRSQSRTQPQDQLQLQLLAKANTGGKRYCKKCELFKADRCHHCKFCNRCTLKMDHHCPWVGNCVGYENHKAFLLFTTYGSLLSIYATIEAGYECYRYFTKPGEYSPKDPLHPELTDLAPVVFMAIAASGLFFSLAVGSLMCYHWWLASSNVTTLENLTHSYPSALLPDSPLFAETPHRHTRKWKADHLLSRNERWKLRREARGINVYNLGWRRNLRDVLVGDRRLSWWRMMGIAMWPPARAVSSMGHAGYSFPYDPDALDRLRELTAELRLGLKADAEGQSDGDDGNDEDDEDGEDEDGEDEDGYEAEPDEEDDHEPRSGDQGRGSLEGRVPRNEAGADEGRTRERYPWFEA